MSSRAGEITSTSKSWHRLQHRVCHASKMHTKRCAITLLIFIACSHRTTTTDAKCETIQIGAEFYRRRLVATIDGYPTGLVVDPRTENMFFILHKRNYTRGIHMLRHGALGVQGLPLYDDISGQCVGIDVPNNIVYIGTNQGLVVYDYTKNELAVERPIGDDDVRSIFFDRSNGRMYITTGPQQEVLTFVNGSLAVKRFEKVPRAYNFVLDSKGNAFYEYVDGRLYFFSVDLFEPIQYKGLTSELKYIMKLSNNDEAVIAVKGSLYRLKTTNIFPEKIGQLGFKITALAFDHRNNIIIGTKGKIYRYRPVDKNDPCPPDDYFMSSI